MVERKQLAIGVGVVAIAALYAAGATRIAAGSGYAGIGPAFFPWVVSGLLAICGILLIREAATGGFRRFTPESAPPEGVRWGRFAIASVGLLVNAALITIIGFTISCAILFAVIAFACGSRRIVRNVVIGLLVAYPVFLMFNKVLGLNLPTLLTNGWL
jgi:putative tricarboxylic transport membrane protein